MADWRGDVMECLSAAQKAHFEEHGYLLVEDQIPPEWLQKIRDEITRFEAEAATMTASNEGLSESRCHWQEPLQTKRPRRFRRGLSQFVYRVVAT